MVIQATRQTFAKPRQHHRSLVNATGTRISNQTVRNRSREVGLTSYRPLRRPALTMEPKRQRRIWAQQKLQEATPWEDIFFTNESPYCVHNESRRKTMHRKRGNSFLPQYIKLVCHLEEVVWWCGQEYVWSCRTEFHTFGGNLNARRCEEEIILEYVVPRANAVGSQNLIFMDDNVRLQRARNVFESLNNHEINHLRLPPLPIFRP